MGSRWTAHQPQRRSTADTHLADVLEPETLIQRGAALAGRLQAIMPIADAAAAGTDPQLPRIVARLSADMFAYAADWLAKLQAELEATPSQQSTPPRRRGHQTGGQGKP